MTIAIDLAALKQPGTRIVLEISGPVDVYTCPPLVEALQRAVGYREVVVDLSRVTHFSAAGVHVLEAAEQALAEHGGQLRLLTPRTGSVGVVLRALDMQNRWPVPFDSQVLHDDRPGIPEQRRGQ